MIYFLAFAALELRPDEQDMFQTRRDIIGANIGKSLLHLVRESWNRDPKLQTKEIIHGVVELPTS